MEMQNKKSFSPSSLNVGILITPRTSFQQQEVGEKEPLKQQNKENALENEFLCS